MERKIVIRGMSTTSTPVASGYAIAYAKGRHAAQEHVPTKENPYRPGSSSYHAWNDGHYDEQSARSLAIERHSALIWSQSDAA